MSMVGAWILWIFPILFILALAIGLVVFLVVRKNEQKKTGGISSGSPAACSRKRAGKDEIDDL